MVAKRLNKRSVESRLSSALHVRPTGMRPTAKDLPRYLEAANITADYGRREDRIILWQSSEVRDIVRLCARRLFPLATTRLLKWS